MEGGGNQSTACGGCAARCPRTGLLEDVKRVCEKQSGVTLARRAAQRASPALGGLGCRRPGRGRAPASPSRVTCTSNSRNEAPHSTARWKLFSVFSRYGAGRGVLLVGCHTLAPMLHSEGRSGGGGHQSVTLPTSHSPHLLPALFRSACSGKEDPPWAHVKPRPPGWPTLGQHSHLDLLAAPPAGAGTHPRCPPNATTSAAGSSRPPKFFTPAQSTEEVAALCRVGGQWEGAGRQNGCMVAPLAAAAGCRWEAKRARSLDPRQRVAPRARVSGKPRVGPRREACTPTDS